MAHDTAADAAESLETRDDVRRAVSTWDSDVAVLVENGTDIGPIRKGYTVDAVDDFDAAPFVLLRLSLD